MRTDRTAYHQSFAALHALTLAEFTVTRWNSSFSVALILAGFGVVLAGCEKWALDAQVKDLCAKDGGIKVYQTVDLPLEKFDKFGVVRIPLKKDAKVNDEYYYEWNIQHFKQGNPAMWRNHFVLFRAVDGKILGEAVGYSRRGGDIPSPAHESSYGCPPDADISVLKQRVFKSVTNGYSN